MEISVCPECGEPAEIQWRAVLESTDGLVEHVRILCVGRHWFLLPTAMLASRSSAGRPAEETSAGRLDGQPLR
jgi:hypothetical protein